MSLCLACQCLRASNARFLRRLSQTVIDIILKSVVLLVVLGLNPVARAQLDHGWMGPVHAACGGRGAGLNCWVMVWICRRSWMVNSVNVLLRSEVREWSKIWLRYNSCHLRYVSDFWDNAMTRLIWLSYTWKMYIQTLSKCPPTLIRNHTRPLTVINYSAGSAKDLTSEMSLCIMPKSNITGLCGNVCMCVH